MPTQIQRQPNNTLNGHGPHGHPTSPVPSLDHIKLAQQGQSQQQQHQLNLQHREALRLALGSILTPKRPPLSPSYSQHSRSSSGTASPAYPHSASGSPSGTHTPKSDTTSGTPPVDSPGHFLHPYYHHGYHPLQPSRLGRSSSTGSPTDHPSSVQHSAHSSPTTHPLDSSTGPPPGAGQQNFKVIIHGPHPHSQPQAYLDEPQINATSSAMMSPIPNDIEMLPPAWTPGAGSGSTSREQVQQIKSNEMPMNIKEEHGKKPVRPGIMPLHAPPSLAAPSPVSLDVDVSVTHSCGEASGRGTPKSKFLQTLQSKSAYDALIHGSFS